MVSVYGGVGGLQGRRYEDRNVSFRLEQVVKKAEDDDGFIIRLLELEGEDTEYHLFLMGNEYPLAIGHYKNKPSKRTGKAEA